MNSRLAAWKFRVLGWKSIAKEQLEWFTKYLYIVFSIIVSTYTVTNLGSYIQITERVGTEYLSNKF